MAFLSGGKLSATLVASAVILQACSGSGADGGWQIESKVDAMTDVAQTNAQTVLRGEIADLEVVVACTSKGVLAYQFRSFDKAGDAVAFKTTMNGSTPVRLIQVRADQNKALTTWDAANSFTNQIQLRFEAPALARAQQVSIRAPLENGVETFTLDQSQPDFREAVAACLPKEKGVVAAPAAPLPTQVTAAAPEPAPKPKEDCWRPPSGPNIIDEEDQILTADEVAEIEKATGRPYETGDAIWGRAENRCPA